MDSGVFTTARTETARKSALHSAYHRQWNICWSLQPRIGRMSRRLWLAICSAGFLACSARAVENTSQPILIADPTCSDKKAEEKLWSYVKDNPTELIQHPFNKDFKGIHPSILLVSCSGLPSYSHSTCTYPMSSLSITSSSRLDPGVSSQGPHKLSNLWGHPLCW